MKIVIAFALLATAAAQLSNEYLPPNVGGFDGGVSYDVGASAPSNAYLAPAASFDTYEVAGSAPAHSFSANDGYRYKTQRRRVVKTARRHRREVSAEYLPPVASYSEPAPSYSVAASAPAVSYSAPAVSYAAPAASYETYDVAASAPAHSFSGDDGYRYKTQRRRVVKTARRHRREVSTEYLPPVASYSAPAPSYSVAASAPAVSYAAPAVSYAAPAASYETYDVAASAPAHSFSGDDGYRYKTQRRRVVKTARRHRREVSTEYLPPVASYSAPAPSYSVAASAPAVSYAAPAVSYAAPAVSYAAPATSYETYDVAASAPAHSFSGDDGYRYKTQRRRVLKTARRHRY